MRDLYGKRIGPVRGWSYGDVFDLLATTLLASNAADVAFSKEAGQQEILRLFNLELEKMVRMAALKNWFAKNYLGKSRLESSPRWALELPMRLSGRRADSSATANLENLHPAH